MQRPKFSDVTHSEAALALVIIAGVCVAVWVFTNVAHEWMPHAATAAVAIAVTITIVERIVRNERERQVRPAVRFARRPLRRALTRLLELVAGMCYAASSDERAVPTERFGYLKAWETEVSYLDFAREFEPGITWSDFVVKETRYIDEMLRGAEGILAGFPETIGQPVLESIERLLDDPLFNFFCADRIAVLRKAAIADGVCRADTPYLALSGSETTAELRGSFIAATQALLDAYRKSCEDDALSIGARSADIAWLDSRASIHPAWASTGAARCDLPATDVYVPTFVRVAEGRFVGRITSTV